MIHSVDNSPIFVSVASFCDPHLLHTIGDACTKAKYPHRLVFGIVDQHPFNRRDELKALTPSPVIRYTHIHPIDSRGVCWARSIAFSLYQNESYLLQIDSHMLFEPEWDAQLIEQIETLRQSYVKPIITTYPYGFEFVDGEAKVLIDISDKTTLVLRPHPDTSLTQDNATLRFRAQHVFKREPIRGCHIAGGFVFTLGRFVHEVPYDPYLYFHGEEQNLAIRAFTHGWDIFHPPHIPLFHLYKQANAEHTSHHWHADWDSQRDFKWPALTESAKQRLMDLVYRHCNLGVYGLGQTRTLADFAQLSGIDYENRCLVPDWHSKDPLC